MNAALLIQSFQYPNLWEDADSVGKQNKHGHLTSTETIRFIRDWENGGRGVGAGGSMEVGEEGDYIPIATLLLLLCVCVYCSIGDNGNLSYNN